MSDNIATITGIIGAVTGAVALVVSIKSYSRVSAMKALDLRLELNRAFNNVDVLLSGIEAYFDHIRESHLAVLAATGLINSGTAQAFENEFEADKGRLRALLAAQPRREQDYGRYAPDQLEAELASVHAFQVQVSSLREKYQRTLASDEERRAELRAAAAANARAMAQRART